ncbi:MAG: hemerythrin domain-containing protein [Planctomycetaceae bacterium]
MAMPDRTDPVILGHILAQHRELHERIVAARDAFAAGPEAARRALDGLRGHLASHFLQEERGGFLEESVTRLPRLTAAAAAAVREHPRLLAELDALIERLAVPDIPQASWHRAGRDFEDFCGHLLAHERNENAVVQEGYNEDLGLD